MPSRMESERGLKDELADSNRSAIISQNELPDLSSERASLLREAILDSLAPALINDREGQIVESYSKTFSWIFDAEQYGFAQWLSGAASNLPRKEAKLDNIFWISGSPGSGKSTLLRHIHQSRELPRLLDQWTKGKAVTIATFFFWESGTVLQRSKEGLLKSLVYQLLNEYPELLHLALPDLWSTLWKASTVERVRLLEVWDENDLESALLRYFEIPSRPFTYLHIDGLDELEGDQRELIRLVERIANCGNVKVCVSSRLWALFAESYRDVPSLRLQDLTKSDMQRFVKGRMSSQPQIAKLLDGHPDQGMRLAEILLEKASGVFLWVSLAITDICQSLGSSEVYSIASLLKHAEKLPQGLDNFYRYRLIDNPPSSHQSSSIFQLLRARQEVAAFTRDNDTSMVTTWEMSLACKDLSTDEVAELQIQQLPAQDFERRCHETVESIHHATASLVRVQDKNHGVTYIHRTVKDWLADPLVWNEILSFAPNFNPHLAHLRSVVLSFKLTIGKPRRTRTILAWWSRIVLAMSHARYIPTSLSTSEEVGKLLDTLNKTLEWYYFPVRDADPRVDHWARSCFGTLEERGKTPYEEPFLALAVKFGIIDYVKQYLISGRYREPKDGASKSILVWGTMYLINRQHSLYPLANPSIIELLLEHGLDPNLQVNHVGNPWKKEVKREKTPWEAALDAVQQGQRRGWIHLDARDEESGNEIRRWTRVLRAFLNYGADPRIEVCATYRDEKENAISLMERLKSRNSCQELEEIYESLRVQLEEIVL